MRFDIVLSKSISLGKISNIFSLILNLNLFITLNSDTYTPDFKL